MPDISECLREYRQFLSGGGFVPTRREPYCVRWVERFLKHEASGAELPDEVRRLRFIDALGRGGRLADWQLDQADDAVKLYQRVFLGRDAPGEQAPSVTGGQDAQEDESALTAEQAKALAGMREVIRLRHQPYSTEKTYLRQVAAYFGYVNARELDMRSSQSVREYLSYLATRREVAASSQNQAFSAILYLFRNVWDAELSDMGNTVRAKRPINLPVVLSFDETRDVLAAVDGPQLLMLEVIYGSGLRGMELCRLRVHDLDFALSALYVRDGKGAKDRTTLLPKRIHAKLREHLDAVEAMHEKDLAAGHGEVYLPYALARKYPSAARELGWQYVFPSADLSVDPRSGKVRRHHTGRKVIEAALRKAVRQAGIVKHVTPHTLRHTFATHLLIKGVNIRQVQQYLGHKRLETTMIYTHVLPELIGDAESPLDTL